MQEAVDIAITASICVKFSLGADGVTITALGYLFKDVVEQCVYVTLTPKNCVIIILQDCNLKQVSGAIISPL